MSQVLSPKRKIDTSVTKAKNEIHFKANVVIEENVINFCSLAINRTLADPIFRYLMRVNCEGEITDGVFRSHKVDMSALNRLILLVRKNNISWHVVRRNLLRCLQAKWVARAKTEPIREQAKDGRRGPAQPLMLGE